ncbi:MAG: DinB family protein [Deltaproteobacteria bacterium]|nr:DinB family protein [Deltaproteobacteria bacterium]
MSQRTKKLVERFTAFSNDFIAVVENCTDEDWQEVCGGEQWTFGVVAHHVASGHFGAIDLVRMIVAGESIPEITMETIDQMNAQHAKEHANCTKKEVLALLRQNGPAFAGYLEGLSEADLARTGYLAAIGGDVSAQQLIEMVILQSAEEHLDSMKAATGT